MEGLDVGLKIVLASCLIAFEETFIAGRLRVHKGHSIGSK